MRRLLGLTMLGLTMAAILLLAAPAEARRRSHDLDTTGSSVNLACSGWGTESLEINAATKQTIFTVSLWGKVYKSFRSSSRSFTTDMIEGDESIGRATMCVVSGRGSQDCHYATAQVTFSKLETKAGGRIEGAISAEGQSVPFQGTMPSGGGSCH